MSARSRTLRTAMRHGQSKAGSEPRTLRRQSEETKTSGPPHSRTTIPVQVMPNRRNRDAMGGYLCFPSIRAPPGMSHAHSPVSR
jgi:hypothetical protein